MKLKEIRKAKGLNQDQLAELTGINKVQISRIERGNISIANITFSNALKLADALGVDPHELLDE